jgi:hypothetical protein
VKTACKKEETKAKKCYRKKGTKKNKPKGMNKQINT